MTKDVNNNVSVEYHNLISARKLFFKNLASFISYLSSDSLHYSNLYEHFKTKLQDSIWCNWRKHHTLKYTVTTVTLFNCVIILNCFSLRNKAAITSPFGSEFWSVGIREILSAHLSLWKFLFRTLESSCGKGPRGFWGNKLLRYVSPHFSNN